MEIFEKTLIAKSAEYNKRVEEKRKDIRSRMDSSSFLTSIMYDLEHKAPEIIKVAHRKLISSFCCNNSMVLAEAAEYHRLIGEYAESWLDEHSILLAIDYISKEDMILPQDS